MSLNFPAVTEDSLQKKGYVTPDDVLRLSKITENYLCSPEANVYQIDFTRFKIRDLETGIVLFEIAKPTIPPPGTLGRLILTLLNTAYIKYININCIDGMYFRCRRK